MRTLHPLSNYIHAIDVHAPLIAKVVTIRPDTAWYTKELWLAKTLRRNLEQRWRKTGYTSGYVQGSVRSCGTPHLVREEKLL